jgi:phosphoribosyl 1,2-cyclic phosphodiesterase
VRFASLGSGSKGNSTLVQHGDTCVMIDCGFSAQETERRLARLGMSATQLTAILVTHEHSDHISGVGALARKHALPVYTSQGTQLSGRLGDNVDVRLIRSQQSFNVGALELQPVMVPHDAREPCQFIARVDEGYLGLLTDLGFISPLVESEYAICTALMLEANHDAVMLAQGPYPQSLKQRVGGKWGHLNNLQSKNFLDGLRDDGLFGSKLQTLVLAHLSETNNSPAKVREVFADSEAWIADVRYACQNSGFDWVEL